MTSAEQIERGVNKLLQHNVSFNVEEKTVKKGKLILFCVKDFFCTFTIICIEKNNKKIIYEIPYPFSFSAEEKKLVFDYTLNSFCKTNNKILDIIKTLGIEKTSKLFNKKLTINVL